MLRITGGEFRGRMIHAPDSDKTRPTQAKLRQALFNSIQMRIPDAEVLDLYAGSGALGFEALSRGASRVVFVESSREALKVLEKNISLLRVQDRSEIVADRVERYLERFLKKLEEGAWTGFDLVFADPPYAEVSNLNWLQGHAWGSLLKIGGAFCLEWGIQKSGLQELPEALPHLVKVREKNYGDSGLTTYERNA